MSPAYSVMRGSKTQSDSVTNIAHQLGYFATIASVDVFTGAPAAIAAVTVDDVAAAAQAMLGTDNRTVGWFEPHEP